MTTGFDFILDSLLPSRRRSASAIEVHLDAETLAMLAELARGQDFSVEELAATLLEQAVIEHYETKSENVRHWEELSQTQQQVAELDFLSMDPSIMAGWNINGETAGETGDIVRRVPHSGMPLKT